MMRSVRYKLIFNGLKFMLHHTRVLNNVVITTVKEMIEMVEILDVRVGKRLIERVWFVYLLHLVIMKYGVISLYFHLPSARDNTDATREISVIFHADPCNKYRIAYI